MRNIMKSTILGVGLLTGVAFSAFAQTDNVAALPPGAKAPTPPAGAVAPSVEYGGPAVGASNWTVPEKQTGPVAPSQDYPGVRPN
jgi:hypothetical protein